MRKFAWGDDAGQKAASPDAQAWLAAIVESSDDAIISKSLDGVVTSWNVGAERIFGYSASEIIANPIMLLIPDDLQDEEIELLRMIREGRRICNYETVRLRKDGYRLEVSLTLSPIKDSEGRIVGASSICRDISERKGAERALARAQAKLREHARELEDTVAHRTSELRETINVLDSFCHSIAHDLRAPLRALSGFSKELRETHHSVLDAEGRDALDRITQAAGRMDQLILDLLRLGRISTAELRSEPVSLEEALDEARSVLALELERSKARVHVHSPLHEVHGNRVLVNQILVNLLGNAVKFVPPDRVPEVTIRSEHLGNKIRLTVQDNGIGIKPAHARKLFQPFLRLVSAEQYPGTGVGLAIVRKAAERLGGNVGVDSELGKGSCFWLELPSLQ